MLKSKNSLRTFLNLLKDHLQTVSRQPQSHNVCFQRKSPAKFKTGDFDWTKIEANLQHVSRLVLVNKMAGADILEKCWRLASEKEIVLVNKMAGADILEICWRFA